MSGWHLCAIIWGTLSSWSRSCERRRGQKQTCVSKKLHWTVKDLKLLRESSPAHCRNELQTTWKSTFQMNLNRRSWRRSGKTNNPESIFSVQRFIVLESVSVRTSESLLAEFNRTQHRVISSADVQLPANQIKKPLRSFEVLNSCPDGSRLFSHDPPLISSKAGRVLLENYVATRRQLAPFLFMGDITSCSFSGLLTSMQCCGTKLVASGWVCFWQVSFTATCCVCVCVCVRHEAAQQKTLNTHKVWMTTTVCRTEALWKIRCIN